MRSLILLALIASCSSRSPATKPLECCSYINIRRSYLAAPIDLSFAFDGAVTVGRVTLYPVKR